MENKRIILQRLTQMRNQIQSLTSNPQVQQAKVLEIAENLLSIVNRIEQYRQDLLSSIQNIEKDKKIQRFIIEFNAQNRPLPQKITMYIWQVLNFVCIHLQLFPNELLQIVYLLLTFELKYQYVQSLNSLKNGLIVYHNLLAKLIKEKAQFQQNESQLIRLFGLIIVTHFENNEQKMKSPSQIFQAIKSEASIVAEMQWIGYIFMQFFNQNIYSSKAQSLIKKVVEGSNNPRIVYYILHIIGNYFQQMVDKRITTELVSGFECSIKDIKQMYNMQTKCLVQLKISQFELKYILGILKHNIVQYRNIIRDYLSLRVGYNIQNKYLEQVEQKWLRNTQVLTQNFHILNNVLFIGGYNNKLQDIVIESLLEQDQLLLSYLQISYLLYRNIESTRYKSKVQLLVQMEKEAKKKLFHSVELEILKEKIEDIDIKLLVLQKVLAPGQLVSVLRLLTNLVHINHRSQIPFQKQPKYLHMILSLTHDSVSQATMKEWAIMFIRNVSEWSPILREQIGKINMQMKVQ